MSDKPQNDLVFLFDVDNTLLDNDRVKADIRAALLRLAGERGSERFWEIYERVRKERDVVDYPETLRQFEKEWLDKDAARAVADFVNNLPYADYLYPGSLSALRHVAKLGVTAIVSDGDKDYQPRKIARAGLTEAVGGPSNVLITLHKDEEASIKDLMRHMPAKHYVMVEDKEAILAEMKEALGDLLTTVWVKQGHYAHDPSQYREPEPDIVLETIGDLRKLSKKDFGK